MANTHLSSIALSETGNGWVTREGHLLNYKVRLFRMTERSSLNCSCIFGVAEYRLVRYPNAASAFSGAYYTKHGQHFVAAIVAVMLSKDIMRHPPPTHTHTHSHLPPTHTHTYTQ